MDEASKRDVLAAASIGLENPYDVKRNVARNPDRRARVWSSQPRTWICRAAQVSLSTDISRGGPSMPDLRDGETAEVKGSGSKPYVLKNVGGVYSCTCPAWRNQSLAIERRTCKHLRAFRGDAAETARLGSAAALPAPRKSEKEQTEGPPLLLAERWDFDLNLAGWWMSEKLDGFRAYWDGQKFISRLGNLIHAPDWFMAGLPDVPLDGELWLG